MIDRITIIGPGLLGASLAIAIKRHHLSRKVRFWGRNLQKLSHCLQQDWCDEIDPEISRAVQESDLIVLCTPVNHICRTLASIAPHLSKDSIVTDVGSTKAKICNFADSLGLASQFIGSHPMAGSDKSGYQNACPNLYEDRSCILTPTSKSSDKNLEFIKNFWSSLGMKLGIFSPETHDKVVASVSHLPHLVSTAICHEMNDSVEKDWLPFSGQGLWDTTRIAGGDPKMWQDIIDQNRPEILKKIQAFKHHFSKLEDIIVHKDEEAAFLFLQQGQIFRKSLEASLDSKKNGG